MKKPIFLYALLLLSVSAICQDTGKDPYAIFGHHSDTKYETGLKELLYISNRDTTSPVKAMAFDLENNVVLMLGRNDSIIDTKDLKPEHILRFLSTDPLTAKYPGSSPYIFTGDNPNLRVDPDGRDWIVKTTWDNGVKNVHLTFTGAILNSSKTSKDDVKMFRNQAEAQIKSAYTRNIKEPVFRNISAVPDVPINVMTDESVEVHLTIEVNIRVINSKSELTKTDHLIEIVPEGVLPGTKEKGFVGGEAPFRGKYVRINELAIASINSGSNLKTVPHELGHTLGLYHPDEAKVSSGQHMEDGTENNNLMYQSHYQHSILKDKSAGNNLNLKQISIFEQNYNRRTLNQNNIPKK